MSHAFKPTKLTIDDVDYFRKNAIAQEIKLYEKMLSEQPSMSFLTEAIPYLQGAITDCESLVVNEHQVLYVAPIGSGTSQEKTNAWRDKASLGAPGSPWYRMAHRSADFVDYVHGREWRGG